MKRNDWGKLEDKVTEANKFKGLKDQNVEKIYTIEIIKN
jgi:hypothetical protein